MYKKNKKVWFYASFLRFIAYFCAILRIIIQDEEESKPIRRYQNDYLKQRVGSQEELLQALAAEGFELTQATLSRDLKH